MAARSDFWTTLTDPLVRQNPVTLQILGICSALAVTTSLATALTMSVSLTIVLTLSAGIISLIRHHIPDTIRLIVQIMIVASLVIVIDQVLQAYFADISRALSVYVGLITTNCLVLGRTEAFARHHAPVASMVDAFGNGLGYSLVLLVIGALRELFGKGELFGYEVLPLAESGGWFTPLSLMLLAPSAFFLLGGLVWAVRSFVPEQAEPPEHTVPIKAGPSE
jgi:Na+-transporting NADH:ubiquinone oxidoreductase subunit D